MDSVAINASKQDDMEIFGRTNSDGSLKQMLVKTYVDFLPLTRETTCLLSCISIPFRHGFLSDKDPFSEGRQNN